LPGTSTLDPLFQMSWRDEVFKSRSSEGTTRGQAHGPTVVVGQGTPSATSASGGGGGGGSSSPSTLLSVSQFLSGSGGGVAGGKDII